MLHVHRAERADTLAHALAEVLAHPLPDPFATEVVAVPAKGVERWLAQRLSHRLGTAPADASGARGDGVCAGVAFPSPAAVVAAAVGGATGVDPRDDPWAPARTVWPLLEVIDASVGQAWCAALGTHLSGGGRRHATARRLAELFASYAAHRPAMLRGWLDGADAPGDLAWQSELWRRLRARVGTPGPAERLLTAVDALRAGPELADLPERVSLFGPTRLSTEHLTVLAALAVHRDVHLWLPHPSPALWAQVRSVAPDTVPARAADPTAGVVAHPLLASLGRDVRELQLGLLAAAPGLVDHRHAAPDPPDTRLGRLQRSLRDDVGAPVEPGAADDRSVQVHACHGAHRQVEVLREVVLGLLAADPTLEPRDVLVMCPDIETFAPLISATFGLGSTGQGSRGAGHPGQNLRVRLADRALRQVNPLLDTVAALLELAGARCTTSQLLDLLASGPVSRRFRLDADDVARLRELVAAAGVRWGLDAAHRAPFRLDGFGQNTWAAGLDRLLLGAAMAGDGQEWIGTALPLPQVESGDVERVGRLAEFVHRLTGVLARLRDEQPLSGWVAALTDGLDALTDTSAADEWQAAQARGELAEALRTAGPHGATVPLGPPDVRGLLDERLRGRPSRANFRTGTLTVATLVPMRSVPHRVVCLLGLDDGVFPRAGVPDGDDVLAREPLAGERDARSEDRQLLLDAVCAATEHLVVVHAGADERTGARRPPAVPIGELLDAVGPEVVVRHPLQPFDARNFAAADQFNAAPFSFDRAELAGAVAAAGAKAPPAAFLAAPLPPVAAEVVTLDELVAFCEHPVKAFLTQRVGLSVFERDDDPADALPIELDGLATWAIGERLLRDRIAGHDLARAIQAEWRRGDLPPGPLGENVLAAVVDGVEPLAAAAARFGAGEPASRDVDVELPGGTRVVGTLDGLYGDVLLRVDYSRLKPKQRIRAWVRVLALTAGTGEAWRGVSVGRGARHGIARATLTPVDAARARVLLADLVALRRDGLCEPLPLATASGHSYANSRASRSSAEVALADARRQWTGTYGEMHEPAHVRAAVDVPGDPRFGGLALRLWEPLLAVEAVDFP